MLKLLHVFGRVSLHFGKPLHALELSPRKTNLLPVVPSLHASAHVQIIILNDSQNDVRSRDAFRALSCRKLSCFLDLCIDIFLTDTAVGKIVMSHIVDVIFVEEVEADNPGARADNFVDPLAMSENVAALLL